MDAAARQVGPSSETVAPGGLAQGPVAAAAHLADPTDSMERDDDMLTQMADGL